MHEIFFWFPKKCCSDKETNTVEYNVPPAAFIKVKRKSKKKNRIQTKLKLSISRQYIYKNLYDDCTWQNQKNLTRYLVDQVKAEQTRIMKQKKITKLPENRSSIRQWAVSVRQKKHSEGTVETTAFRYSGWQQQLLSQYHKGN